VRATDSHAPLSEAELAGAQDETASARIHGRLAGILFIAGGLAGTPAVVLHQPAFPPETYLLTVLAVLSGAGCLLAPWQRLSRRWLHAVCAIASLEVFVIYVLLEPVFAWYFVMIAVFVAYVSPTRAEVTAQLGFAVALMFGGAALHDAHTVIHMLIAVPALVAVTALVWTLRKQLERRQAGYRQLSRRDPLTGVGNYRELQAALQEEAARYELSGKAFALVLVDLNGFKAINDLYGHLTGDRVLRRVASILREAVRGNDLVARHGGDEFGVVAPEAGEHEAEELSARLEAAISRLSVADRDLSASTGCAVFPRDGDCPDQLITVADRRLRKQKRGEPTPAEPDLSLAPPLVLRA